MNLRSTIYYDMLFILLHTNYSNIELVLICLNELSIHINIYMNKFRKLYFLTVYPKVDRPRIRIFYIIISYID